jgi:signal transduction histidine kinase
MITTQDLRAIQVFADLPEEQLEWLVGQMEEMWGESGEVMFREGEPADHMYVFLEGELQGRVERPGGDLRIYSAKAGDVTGLLPFSRLQNYAGTGRALGRVHLARVHKSNFPEMLQRMPKLTERLVSLMLDRVREYTRQSEQRDKLAALGKLSAGLAHELNNPAAALKRTASSIRDVRREIRAAYLKIDQINLSREQRIYIAECEEAAIKAIDSQDSDAISSIERGDREQELEDWMEEHGVIEPWKLAPTLAEGDLTTGKLEEIAARVGLDAMNPVLLRINHAFVAARMIREIEHSASRIFELVQAIKEYTYMDQAPEQEIDIHSGLESTLTILGYRLRKNSIRVERAFDRTIPRICAFGVELNQVWTNLIANAIEAMPEGGTLRLETCQDPMDVIVEVHDNGTGIATDVMPRIFDPFFTTKGVGDGTGLGLDTAMRVVRKHRGGLTVKSKPGETIFRVSIPKRPAAVIAN